MRLVFAGTPEVAVPSLDRLVDSSHDVVAVLTRPDARVGRGRHTRPSPVAERAHELGIPLLKPSTAKDPALLADLTSLAPDCCPVVAYGGLLPESLLHVPRHGWVNLHFSLLPAWRGAAPVQHAVLHGDAVTGASTFRIVKELDSGPIFGVVTEQVRPTDTSGDLLHRLAESGAELLAATIDGIAAGGLEAREQPNEGVSFAPKLEVADAHVDFATPAQHVDRLVRACTPAPGAWTTFRGDRLKLAPVTIVEAEPTMAPGNLAVSRDAVLVGTATNPVALGEVQPAGKRMMSALDWARGVRLTADDRLG
jgi:methionyl-tRNA formyltransferase